MISISFIPNVFMVTTIFMIILTSVSTKSTLYQLVKKNEDYDSYLSRSDTELNVEKMSIEDFYNTIHNFDNKYIPEPFTKYDYDEYTSEITNYCNSDFVTLKYFKREININQFTNAIKEYNKCLNIMIDDHNKKNDETKGPQFTINDALNNFSDYDIESTLKKTLNTMMHCLNTCFVTHYNRAHRYSFIKQNLPDSSRCFDYNYTESTKTQKVANQIMGKLNKDLKFEYYESFVNCSNEFKSKFIKFLPENTSIKETIPEKVVSMVLPSVDYLARVSPGFSVSKTIARASLAFRTIRSEIKQDLTLKELFIAQVLLKNYHLNLKNLDYSRMFHVILQLNQLQITEVEKPFCRIQNKFMSARDYTATKMSYMTLPVLTSEETEINYQNYKKRRYLIINHLMNIDHENNTVYEKLLDLNDKITLSDFKNIIKKRALKHEDYTSYAKRIKYLSDYLPLPKNLWNKEKKISEESMNSATDE